MTVNFGSFLTIPELYEPEFDEKIKDKIIAFELSSTSDGSLAEETNIENLELDLPLIIDSEEFKKFKKTEIKKFSKKYSKLIKLLEKNDIYYGINFGFYQIPY